MKREGEDTIWGGVLLENIGGVFESVGLRCCLWSSSSRTTASVSRRRTGHHLELGIVPPSSNLVEHAPPPAICGEEGAHRRHWCKLDMSAAVVEINRLKSCLGDDESGESFKTTVDEPT
ncbi:hypothetical protein TIFTF001_027452 [Ficus carica]|uniref:Uncharacterized protein n=1 Tax=Ficus carica TaxID=3494 RepID=A0AA88DN65_FICCA|nr:hypothetical protein TIFTF001_027452 [Ficus carica]